MMFKLPLEMELNNRIPNKVKNHLDYCLPGIISKEILGQLPGILGNNYQMRQILDNHIGAVDDYSTNILSKI